MGDVASKSLPAGTRVGDYEITGLLGAGGMGTVYAGEHPVIGKRVAIKVLHPALAIDDSMVDRFVREARAVVRIGHRNIVDVFTFGEAEGVGHYFVMPLLAGESLADRVGRAGPMALDEALAVVRQIAGALDAAHAAGIYHRDLKPDNVFLADDGGNEPGVRVLDFGIAKLIHDEVSQTQTGAQMGTPLFMSPEQWAGAAVDGRTDVYALGVLTHHVLTGRYPFESDSVLALMSQHAHQTPVPASEHGADPRIDPVIDISLAKDPGQRFESAGAFARALSEAAASPTTGSSAAAKAAGPRPTAPAPAAEPGDSLGDLDVPPGHYGRQLVRVAVVIAAAVALGALAWFALSAGLGTGADRPPADEAAGVQPAGAIEVEGGATSERGSPSPAPASGASDAAGTPPGDAADATPDDTPEPAPAATAPAPDAERPNDDGSRRRARRTRRSERAEPQRRSQRGKDRSADGDAEPERPVPAAEPEPARRAPAKDPGKEPGKDKDKWGDTVDPFSSQ